jgi:hypothetical protein
LSVCGEISDLESIFVGAMLLRLNVTLSLARSLRRVKRGECHRERLLSLASKNSELDLLLRTMERDSISEDGG